MVLEAQEHAVGTEPREKKKMNRTVHLYVVCEYSKKLYSNDCNKYRMKTKSIDTIIHWKFCNN